MLKMSTTLDIVVLLLQIHMFQDIGLTHKVSKIDMTARCSMLDAVRLFDLLFSGMRVNQDLMKFRNVIQLLLIWLILFGSCKRTVKQQQTYQTNA